MANSEVGLQVYHLVLHKLGLEHGNGSLLEGVRGATVEVATTRANTMPMSVWYKMMIAVMINIRRDVL